MKKVILLPESEASRWDGFVEKHAFGWLTSFSSWSVLLTRLHKDIKTYRLAVIGEKGEILAGLPLYLVRSLPGGKKLIGAPLGTFFDPLVTTKEELCLLLNAAAKLKDRTGSSLVKIKAFKSKEMFSGTDFGQDRLFLTHLLPLTKSLPALWESFPKKGIRQNVKKAECYHPEFSEASNLAAYGSFYRLYTLTRRRLGLPALPFSFFKAVHDIYVPENKAHLFLLSFKQKPIAGLLVFSYKGRWSAEALGWDINYKFLSPSVVIYWEAIKTAIGAGASIFDFGRTSAENKGLLTFKRHWGTEERQLPIFTFSSARSENFSLPLRARLEGIAHNIFRLAPSPAYLTLSKIFYRIFIE